METETAKTLSPATLELLLLDLREALRLELGNLHNGLQDAGRQLVDASRAVAALPRDQWGSALGCATHDVQRVADASRRALHTAKRLERLRERLERLERLLELAKEGWGE